MSLLHQILQWDRELFNKVNGEWTNSFFDLVLPYTRNAIIWAPFYLFFIVFVSVNYKKSGLFWILFGILAVATTDIVSSWIIKENFFRLRPCGDPELAGRVRFLVSYCPQSSSFTSSHAANHFALAAFIFFTLRGYVSKWLWLIFFWAFIISYAQVYVGVHYPVDIICGGIVGGFIGYGWARVFAKSFLLTNEQHK